MLLAKLLRTLSDEETAKVRADFHLSERSRLLFERIATSSSTPPDSSELANAFRISTENLYRLFSEIVNECVRILAPKEEFSVLKFFRSKYLYRPFITEVYRIEKKLLHERDRSALERFYEYVFFSMMKFPVDLPDFDLAEEFGMKWHRIKITPSIDDDLYVQIRAIICRINSLPIRKKMTLDQMAAYSSSLLDPISIRAQQSPNPLARSYYFQAEYSACSYAHTDPQEPIGCLERSLKVVRESPELFEPEWGKIIELQIAYELAVKANKAKEGLEIFRKFYSGQTPDIPRNALYLERFMQVAFLAHDFVTARKLLIDFERYQVVRTTPTIYIFALLMKTMLDLVDNNVTSASLTIERAKKINAENFFLATEVHIRSLETIITLKRGEFELADQLAVRNIKWLRSRRLSLTTTSWIYFYQMTAEIIRFRLTGEPIRKVLIEHFHNTFRAEYPDYFLLLESEIQSTLQTARIKKVAA